MLNPTILVYERNELIKLVEHHVQTLGPDCNLNHLDVSNIKDMSYVFEHSSFQGDISNWDVSKVVDMRFLFSNSLFKGDVSKWNLYSLEKWSNAFSMHNNSLLGYLCMVENKKYPEKLIQDERFMHTIQCVESLDLSVQEAAKYLYLLHTQESVPHVGLHNFSF